MKNSIDPEQGRVQLHQPVRRSFELVTGGRQPEIDAMSIILTLINELPEEGRTRWLGYIAARSERHESDLVPGNVLDLPDDAPPGYVRLPKGVRCRCVKLRQGDDDRYYCCGGNK